MIQVFRQSLEAVGLSQVCKMLRQLTGQIIAHYSSSKIRKTHLCLSRLDQEPHTTFSKIQKKKKCFYCTAISIDIGGKNNKTKSL